MSLWTPSGEHPVDRTPSQPAGSPPPDPTGPRPPDDEPALEDLPPEQRAQVEEMARQMEAAQARMLSMPSGLVIGQQSMQFYELAAMYLSQEPPRLDDARIAIDALAGVVDKLGTRLGEAEQPVRQALHQLQLAFVQVARDAGAEPSAPTELQADEAEASGAAGPGGGGGGNSGDPGESEA